MQVVGLAECAVTAAHAGDSAGLVQLSQKGLEGSGRDSQKTVSCTEAGLECHSMVRETLFGDFACCDTCPGPRNQTQATACFTLSLASYSRLGLLGRAVFFRQPAQTANDGGAPAQAMSLKHSFLSGPSVYTQTHTDTQTPHTHTHPCVSVSVTPMSL